MRRKVILVVVLVPVVIVAAIGLMTGDQSTDEKTVPADPRLNQVVLENAYQYRTELSEDNIVSIQQELYKQVDKHGGDSQFYGGNVRQGSLLRSTTPYQATNPPVEIPVIEFVVDIPEAKQSYAVKLSGGENYPYTILHVTCPAAQQAKYPDFGCINEEQ